MPLTVLETGCSPSGQLEAPGRDASLASDSPLCHPNTCAHVHTHTHPTVLGSGSGSAHPQQAQPPRRVHGAPLIIALSLSTRSSEEYTWGDQCSGTASEGGRGNGRELGSDLGQSHRGWAGAAQGVSDAVTSRAAGSLSCVSGVGVQTTLSSLALFSHLSVRSALFDG